MSSRILHLQTLLECLKKSYPSTRLVSEVPLRVNGVVINVFTRRLKNTVTMNVTFYEDRPYFPVSHLQGESVSEESNNTFEFIEPTPSTVSDIDPHPIILPTNQVPWKPYYRRNLKKEVGSSISQPPTLVQDFKPPRDQGMENPTEPCTNNTMNENDRSDVAVLDSGDETETQAWRMKMGVHSQIQANGTLDRHKARVLLSVVINKDWPLYQLDVKNAFLNGDLIEVYMSLCLALKPSLVNRYNQGHSDHTLFTKVFETGKIAVLIVYVDDIVLSGDDQAEISQLKQRMGNEFEIKDLENLKYFLGMEVTRSKEGISASQRKYTLDLLTATVDKEQYQHLVGKLIYLSHTRPDISFAMNVVSQFMQAPCEEHMEAIKRIMRYLKTTPGKGLMFRKIDKKTIETYTDSDWAGSVVNRKSTFDYCTFVWGNLVTSRSKKQNVVARSSAEVEYRAISLGICEEIWLQKDLSDLHQECDSIEALL
ncbi:Cysteine-rich RLK (receptor-like protein kinase) 8 [Cucumis melo var. makuwa]|uniref:Cysteine-rich RLK (Receptor-like protein kinase) 8 n=1 Tax=Cucumis melo var. makuwa TaxID=1194695 RepID=A0A5D3CN18_CUCMM|nr:Cysteine-rich RLK (receptor-like protein kinase) 8 [Cucumis melo var. makuwa]TYK11639.1 Cysteine-rich RLK (receptor-like protein kinase) 8 [Cucumis melo var. makuwa]